MLVKQVPRAIQDLVLNKVSKGEGLWFCLFDKESFWQTVKPRSLCGCGPNVSNFQTLSIQFPQKKRRGRKVTKMPQHFTTKAKYVVTRENTAILHLSLSLSPHRHYWWWMDRWMDLLEGTGVSTALRIVQWPKPFLTPAKPLRLGWLFQRKIPSTATTLGATLQYLQ